MLVVMTQVVLLFLLSLFSKSFHRFFVCFNLLSNNNVNTPIPTLEYLNTAFEVLDIQLHTVFASFSPIININKQTIQQHCIPFGFSRIPSFVDDNFLHQPQKFVKQLEWSNTQLTLPLDVAAIHWQNWGTDLVTANILLSGRQLFYLYCNNSKLWNSKKQSNRVNGIK